MADSSNYILRSDDGQLYRVNKGQLAAFKVPPGDPANQKAGQLAQLHDAAKKAAAPITKDLVCFFAVKDSGGPPSK